MFQLETKIINLIDQTGLDIRQTDLGKYFANNSNFMLQNNNSEFYHSAFNKTFISNEIIKSQNLIKKFDLHYEFRNNTNVISGFGLIDQFFNNDFDNTYFIIDKNGLGEIDDKISNRILSIKTRTFIEEINSGNDLKKIIKKIKINEISLVVGIGGGRCADLAKFISYKTMVDSMFIPSSLSTHVYASPKIHALPQIKECGYELTIDGKAPNLSILDLDLLERLSKKNQRLIFAGFGDLMAFWTSEKDWTLACKNNNNQIDPFVEHVINDIFNLFDKITIDENFSHWVRNYILIQNQLCHITDWVGSAPASGSEHLFANQIEKYHKDNLPLHGELVALGVIIFSSFMNVDISRIIGLLDKFNIPRSIGKIGVKKDSIVNALMDSKSYGRLKKRYTIVEELSLEKKEWSDLIDKLIDKKILYI